MERDVTVFQCDFQLYVEKATVSIKFPCTFFLQWKTTNGKKSAEGKCRPTSINTVITFQQALSLSSELIFENNSKRFTKKETMINLNLISKSRQDQSKLVGRIAVDLSAIANEGQYNKIKNHKLAYCSIDGQLVFSAIMKHKRKTNLSPKDLDKSSFNEYVSFYTAQSREPKTKRETRQTNDEQISIGYGRQANQNVIDSHHNEFTINPKHHQIFYVLQSPRLKNSALNLANQTNRVSKQRSIGSDTALTSLSKQQIQISTQMRKDFNKLSISPKNTDSDWEQDKIKFRDEIDTNKQKIGQMQKRIMELFTNLENSKRYIEFAQRQNRQKQEIIKQLKDNYAKVNQQVQVNLWKEKYQALQKEIKQDVIKYRQIQDSLKKEIQQNQLYFQNLRRQTQELRKIWAQKREHYDEKLKKSEDIIREKEKKINLICRKNQQMTKFKYQNQMLKALLIEKQSKMKLMERDLIKLSEQLNETKKINLSQENYNLKLENAQSLKKIEQMTQQIQKNHGQIERYHQNYIKIQIAYEIQTKTHQNVKDKNRTFENDVMNLQKQNLQLKSSIQNNSKVCHQTEKKYLQIIDKFRKIQSQCEQSKVDNQILRNLNETIKRERDNISSLVEKLKIENEVRQQDFQKELKRMQIYFLNSLQHKQKSYNLQKKELQNNIVNLKQLISCQQKDHQSKSEKKQQQLAQISQKLNLSRAEIQGNLNRIKILQQTIKDKQEIIKLNKQENESLKSANNDLIQSLSKMRQTEKQLQENILILEEQSQNIIYILEQKEETDREIQSLKLKFDELLIQKSLILQKLHEAEADYQEQKLKNAQFIKCIHQKDHEKQVKQQKIKDFLLKIQDINNQNSTMREECLYSKTQINKLKQIIKEINGRYEDHIKIEQKYNQQINTIRQERQQLQAIMNKNSNQLVTHNQQLQHRIIELENAIQRFESCVESQEDENKELQSIIHDSNRVQNQQKAIEEQLKTKVEFLQSQMQQNQKLKNIQKVQIYRLNNYLKEIKLQVSTLQQNNLKMSNIITQKNIALRHFEETLIQLQAKIKENSKENFQLQNNTTMLKSQIVNQHEKKTSKNYTITQQKQSQSKTLFEDQEKFSQREQELQQLLFQSDRKNEDLKGKLLLIQAEYQLSKQLKNSNHQQIYESFSQFQREQMTKIIEQQRLEIDRIQSQLKNRKSTDSSSMGKRILQLQAHISQLQSTFKSQLNRILEQQLQKQTCNSMNGGLSIINEQYSQEDIYKSQRSQFGSPSRVKSSLEVVQLLQLREKLQLLQQQKQHLQQQFQLMEQQKFNLLSTINQKDIELEQMGHLQASLKTEIAQLRHELQNNLQKYQYLEQQAQSLKNQLTFGSTINFNVYQHSVTRSEPILNNEEKQFSNKDIQIQNLKAEIQRHKSRQEELLWNIKDLEILLFTVTQNLNLLNASTMNSVFYDSDKKIQSDDQKKKKQLNKLQARQYYSKQKLLLQLNKNQQLKQLTNSLIRELRQRYDCLNQQQKVTIDLQTSIFQSEQFEAAFHKINKLEAEFQSIKTYVMKIEAGTLKEQASNLLGQIKNAEIMKNILFFEEQLKSVRSLTQKQSQKQLK